MTRREALSSAVALPALLRAAPPRPRYDRCYVLLVPRVVRTVKCTSCWDEFTVRDACKRRRLRAVDSGWALDGQLFDFVHDCPRCGVARAVFHDRLPDDWDPLDAIAARLRLAPDEVSVEFCPLTARLLYTWRIPSVVRDLVRTCVPHALTLYPKLVLRAVCRGGVATFDRESIIKVDDPLTSWDLAEAPGSVFSSRSLRTGLPFLSR